MNDRLYRSVDDRVIAGVCGGLAVRLRMDPSLVRIAYALVALVTGIFPLLVLYVIMAAVVPEEPTGFAGVGRPPSPPGPDAVPGWTPPTPTAAWPSAGAAPAPEWPAAATAPEPGTSAGEPATAAPGAPAPAPGWPQEPSWSRHQRLEARREQRRTDPILAVVGGLALVGLGAYFLVRDRLAIDWDLVWPAGLVALGAVVLVAAFLPRR